MVRDPARIKTMLSVIEEIWTREPDLRLGQLIENVVHHLDGCIYHVEDEDLVARLRTFYLKELE